MALSLCGAHVVALHACGGAVEHVRASSPFTDQHARFFEDGLDFVGDPQTLEGPWLDEWQAELQERVALSDLIARVKVTAVRSSRDRERTMLQLDLEIREIVHGANPSDVVPVSAHEGDQGFPSVRSSETQLLNAEYLLFVKWYVDETGQVLPHWHLSPDTDAVRTKVQEDVRRVHAPVRSRR
jgi:hypothetical protein